MDFVCASYHTVFTVRGSRYFLKDTNETREPERLKLWKILVAAYFPLQISQTPFARGIFCVSPIDFCRVSLRIISCDAGRFPLVVSQKYPVLFFLPQLSAAFLWLLCTIFDILPLFPFLCKHGCAAFLRQHRPLVERLFPGYEIFVLHSALRNLDQVIAGVQHADRAVILSENILLEGVHLPSSKPGERGVQAVQPGSKRERSHPCGDRGV